MGMPPNRLLNRPMARGIIAAAVTSVVGVACRMDAAKMPTPHRMASMGGRVVACALLVSNCPQISHQQAEHGSDFFGACPTADPPSATADPAGGSPTASLGWQPQGLFRVAAPRPL